MTQEDIFDQNQADFYGVDISVIRKAMKREIPHMFLVKEDGKFKSIMMTQSEYEEKYQKRNSNPKPYKYNVPDKYYGRKFSKDWIKEVFG